MVDQRGRRLNVGEPVEVEHLVEQALAFGTVLRGELLVRDLPRLQEHLLLLDLLRQFESVSLRLTLLRGRLDDRRDEGHVLKVILSPT
ncbi:hypothetical protein GS532_17780 [Rhodococcus hoagii]|nr:hypothetical protein [Prescottella equi]